jgi:hypothetical protein
LCASKLKLIMESYGAGPDRDRRVSDALFSMGSDPEAFSQEAISRYLRLGKMPIVVFDNVDQLGVAAQTRIFTTAERFSNHLGCVSILVMREESYCTAQLRKQLTAYTIRPYHLSSPGFRDMIKVRIEFATRATAENRERSAQDEVPRRLSEEILDFFEVLRRSVFHKNGNISRLIEAVSFGNMRLALDLFNNFIISGATNTPEILHIFRSQGGYSVPFHQFAKSVILGDYRYYKQSRSLILNVFDVTDARNASHFTGLRLLKFTGGSFGVRKTSDGFIDLQVVMNAMIDEFDNEEDVVTTITRYIELGRQLLELDTRRCDSLDGASAIRITSAGQYYQHYLTNSLAYLDLVWHDTPTSSVAVCDALARLMPETEMRNRFERVEMFLAYLTQQEDEELSERSLSREGDFFYGPFMPRIRKQYEHEKAFIGDRLRLSGKAI